MEVRPDGVEAAVRLPHTENHGFGLFLVGPEETVPEDEDAAVVPVEIEIVHSMVNAVRGRCAQDPFHQGELTDRLGMQ